MPNINDLTYNGTNASSLGVFVTGSGTFNAPELDITRYEVPGRNGDIILSNHRYKNIDVAYPAFIPDAFMAEVQSIRNWLRSSVGYARLEDTYDTTHYRMGIATELQEFSPVNRNKAANFQMVFNCKPQRYLKSGETEQTVHPSTKSYSGNPASFESSGVYTMTSAAVNLVPQQNLNGYTKPWAGGAGKNKWEFGDVSITGTYSNLQLTTPLAAGTYTISTVWSTTSPSAAPQFRFRKQNASALISVTLNYSSGDRRYATFTLDEAAYYVYAYSAAGSSGYTATINDTQIETGSLATAYEPYENICPITGYDSATLYVSPTTSQADATTYPVTFTDQGTVYGGTFDWVSGVLTVTWGLIASYNGETLPGGWLSDRDAYAAGTTPTTGAQVAYELATPLTYNLTPQTVSTLVGQNYVWAEDTVTVQFSAVFNLTNPTNYTAKPTFKITNPNSDTLTVNGKTLTIGAYTGEMIIDCETENAYAGSSNLNSLVTGTFPTFESGVNTISCSAATCKVIPRWWEL